MYFDDLSPYTSLTRYLVPEVLHVGWLAVGRPYTRGPTSSRSRDTLHWLARRPVETSRGIHPCWFCGKECYQPGETPPLLGHAELWVPRGDGLYFAAPNLIVHYVDVHEYRPPEGFVEAVEAIDPLTFGRDLAAEAAALIESKYHHGSR